MNLPMIYLNLITAISLSTCNSMRSKRYSSSSLTSTLPSSNSTTSTSSSQWIVFCNNQQHQKGFLYQSDLISNGCQVECLFFSSSSAKYHAYYDSLSSHKFNLENGRNCGDNEDKKKKDYVCRKGQCIPKNWIPGRAELRIIRAELKKSDPFSDTDSYIKVYLKHDGKMITIGQTTTVSDDNYPFFNQAFMTPIYVNLTDYFYLKIYDKDSSPDDYLGSLEIKIKDKVDKGVNSGNFGNGWIYYAVRWYQAI